MKLADLKVGDTVTRLLCGKIPMTLKVTAITEDKIICGPWEFSRDLGVEIDEDLGWTGKPDAEGNVNSGSYLQHDGVNV
jgi:hypothetical protein